jgi:hypothetical protein
MDKKISRKDSIFKLIQFVFLCAFIFFILLGIWGIFYEDDMPFVGFFWAGILVILYWTLKKYFARSCLARI